MEYSSPLEALESLYMFLRYDVALDGPELVVSKVVAGFIQRHRFRYLPDLDVEAALRCAAQLESVPAVAAETVVVTDSPPPPDIQELFGGVGLGIFSLTEWLNRVLRDEDTCHRAQQTHLSFSKKFVDPRLEPVTLQDLLAWARGEEGPDAALGHVVILLGPAGFGKTTIAARLAHETATRHLENPDGPVPVFISLEDFRAERRWDDLLASYSNRAGMPEITPRALKFLIDHGRALVLVDGLDELAERGGVDAATETLRQLVNITTSGRLLVTARESYAANFARVTADADATYVYVRGVDPAARESLLEGKAEGVRRTVLAVLSNASEDGSFLATNPILIHYLAQVVEEFEDGGSSALALRAAAGPVVLLAEVIDRLHRREIARQQLELTVADYREIYGEMAVQALIRGRTTASEDNLEVPKGPDLLRTWVEIRLDRVARAHEGHSMRSNLANRWVGSLRSHQIVETRAGDDGRERIIFRHPFLRDAVAAMHLAEQVSLGNLSTSPRDVGERVTDYVGKLLPDDVAERLLAAQSRTRPGYAFAIHARSQKLLAEVGSEHLVLSGEVLEQWTGASAHGIRIERMMFSEVDFSGVDFSGTQFVRCRFMHCRFAQSALPGAQFIRCGATSDSINELRSHGVDELPYQLDESRETPTVQLDASESFTVSVLVEFFRRFLRTERGKHQRSAKMTAFTRGLDPVRADFTRDYLLEWAQRTAIISEVPRAGVYRFNPDYQRIGDSLVFDGHVPAEFAGEYRELVGLAERFLA